MDAERRGALLVILRDRFESNIQRHAGVSWLDVLERLEARPAALDALGAMEASGGEPDLVAVDGGSGAFVFFDCSPESPAGRRSLCYDRAALDERTEHKPAGDAVSAAASMGAELLTEDEYRYLQGLGEFDLKTSSWIRTPEPVRALGGALFMDRRYGRVFVYHNSASSYYGVRGYRASVRA